MNNQRSNESKDISASESNVKVPKKKSEHNARYLNCFEQGTGADVQLVVKNQVIKAAKFFLVANSPVFAEQLAHSNALVINDFDYEVIKTLIRAMYAGDVHELEQNPGLALKLMKAARHYKCESIQEQLEGFFRENPSVAINGRDLSDFLSSTKMN